MTVDRTSVVKQKLEHSRSMPEVMRLYDFAIGSYVKLHQEADARSKVDYEGVVKEHYDHHFLIEVHKVDDKALKKENRYPISVNKLDLYSGDSDIHFIRRKCS